MKIKIIFQATNMDKKIYNNFLFNKKTYHKSKQNAKSYMYFFNR